MLHRSIAYLFVAATLLACRTNAPPPSQVDEVVVATWNILHGGREDGSELGPQRVVQQLRRSGADLVAVQETYGSGELLAEALGMHLVARGTNVSILSRYPVLAEVSVDVEFSCVGAIVQLPSGRRVAFYSLWLPYDRDIWLPGVRRNETPSSMIPATASSAARLAAIMEQIPARLAAAGLGDVPVVLAGDFNSMSHLDYSAVARDQHGFEIEWPTSMVAMQAGYRDVYREANPRVDRAVDRTWSPRFPDQEQDRIDFIYFRGSGVRVLAAQNEVGGAEFPSDHAMVTARLLLGPAPAVSQGESSRVASYNIRHGAGMDDRVDLARTAGTLAQLSADLIGLQEVDLGVRRSGAVNQPAELAAALGMHAAFGSFFDYQGGRYGMAILSRWPLRRVRALRLPDGNEPRVALVAEVHAPSGEVLTVVNVHFDWVADDRYRWAQSQVVAEFLRTLETPFVLLGDFNDVPDSRTLQQFRELALEACKSKAASVTFPAPKPTQEIDFVFAGPLSHWRAASAQVVEEILTSDHRPVVAELQRY